MSNTELEKKEVSEDILEKVLRFSKERVRFTVKDLFQTYPNNQEYQLRYALINLRIDKKIFMFGNKRGAYYSIHPEEPTEELTEETKPLTWQDLILREARKFSGKWFKRTDLDLKDYSVPTVINTLKELIDLGKIEKRGELRWTEYFLLESVKPVEVQKEIKNDLKIAILNFIKKSKIVTIPMIVEELELQRYQVLPIIEVLVNEEEIWHEGLGRGSKYIYKDVDQSEIERITDELNKERKINQKVDQLSDFLFSDEVAAVSIGRKSPDLLRMKFFTNGETRRVKEFPTIEELINYIHELTVIRG